MTEPRKIRVLDAGPIRQAEAVLPEGGGVLVWRGRNGCGKTTAVNAIARALGGSEAVGKRDGAISGRVEIDGITLTLGKQVRASGESELVATSLQGGELVRLFVDPGLKDPAAADAARIKAGLGLARVAARPEDFVRAVGGPEAMATITAEAELQTTDPVDLAGRVKRAAEAAARKHEAEAMRLSGEIDARTKANEGIALDEPHEEAALAAAHEAAVRTLATVESEAASRARRLAEAAEAANRLQAAQGAPGRVSAGDAERQQAEAHGRMAAADEAIRGLEEQLRAAKAARGAAAEAATQADALVASVRREEAALAGWRETVERGEGVAPIAEIELLRLRAAVEGARAAMARGAEVRAALVRVVEIDRLRSARDGATERAGIYRKAAATAEGVLSGLFAGTGAADLQVRDGRLIAEVPGRGEVYFAELSHGQRYRIAIGLATAGCGPGGLIPLDQVGYESLDPDNRREIWEEARARNVTVITAEADGGELRVEEYQPAGEV